MNGHQRKTLLGAVLLMGLLGCEPPGVEGGSSSTVGVRQQLGSEPDFVVTKVSAPASAWPGSMFQSTVEVCNRGAVGSGVDVNLYFSDDDVISPSDFWADSLFVGYLSPGQCQSQVVSVTTSVPTDGPWYVGAYADPYESLLESDENNNGLASELMGIGNGADFVITSVTGPASAETGQFITTQVTVCNRGTQGDSTDVAVYLSADDIIRADVPPNPPEDSFLGSYPAGYLSPGQCSTVPISGNAYLPPLGTEGPYFIGAVADPYESRPELIESNNSLAGYRMGVGYRPDFVITSVKGPASAENGQAITAQVTVCNRGTQSGSTDVAIYLSVDDIIRADVPPTPPEDSFLGSFPVGYLYPSQCSTIPVSGNAYPPPPGTEGPYFIGAVADPYESQPELIEDNNSLAGYRMGVGYRADFAVTSVTGPASVESGQPITAQVTVCNRGTQAGSTDVAVYLSVDDIIRADVPPNPPEDSFVGSAPIGYLYPGQCSTVPISGNAYLPPPGTEGPYFVGAVADPYESQPELIEDNNSLAGYRMGVGYRADFVITSVTGPASAEHGQPITAQVTVCNRGTQGDSTEVGVYLSVDDIIRTDMPPGPPEDSFVGSATTNHLYPGQCSTVPVSGNAYTPPPGMDGPYFIGAVADPYESRPELIEDNNSLAGYRMGVGYRADFAITSVTGPASAEHGQPITAQVTVCNRGTQADSTEVGVYLSADDIIRTDMPPGPPEDSFVGSVPTGYLFPGQCSTVSVSGNAYTPPPGMDGPYFVGAVADPYESRLELIEDNNSLAGYRMGVGYRADFTITSVTGPASAESGQPITAQVTVCNRGTQADSTEVEVYLSTDDAIHAYMLPGPPEDSFVGSASTGYLYPGQCSTVPVSGNAHLPPPGMDGPYFVGAVADPYESRLELIEDNNSLAGYRMGVGYRADFAITSVTGPASAENGQPITAQVTVCNRGTQADSTEVGVYLSADDIIRADMPPSPPEDYFLGSAPTGYLYPGQCSTLPISGNAYPPPPGMEGPYFVGAVADPYESQPELIEDNNSLAGYRMGVGYRADFAITSVTGPASAQTGQVITAQVTVCNRGTQGDSTEVGVYLSADDIIRADMPPSPPEDYFLGSAPTGYLYPGQCSTVPVSGNAYPPPPGMEGPYFVGAVADPYESQPELIEDNNSLAGYRMGVGYRADFVITSVSGPYSVRPGNSFNIYVGICNRGQQADTVDVELYLSTDTDVRVPMPPGPIEDKYLGTLTGTSLAAGACTTRSLQVTAPSVMEGAYYLGAVADPSNMREELIEDNNAKAGTRIGVGYKADFTINSVTGPYSVRPGNTIMVGTTVCNRGQQADTVDVELYLSADTDVRVPTPPGPPEDSYLGTIPGISLTAGSCTTRWLSVTAPPVMEGAYYLGAVADPSNMREELIEDNNARAGNVIGVGFSADFAITSATGPSTVVKNASFWASVNVCNRGQQADVVDVDLYFSEDSTIQAPTPPIPPEDFYLGTLSGVSLPAGTCTTRSIMVNANVPGPGSYYLGAVADPHNSRVELIENNNIKTGAYLTVIP